MTNIQMTFQWRHKYIQISDWSILVSQRPKMEKFAKHVPNIGILKDFGSLKKMAFQSVS